MARLAAFACCVGAVIGLLTLTPIGSMLSVDAVAGFAETLGPWGPITIVIFGILSPLLFLPRWPVAFVGGMLYGVLWGAILSNVASTIGSAFQYYLARGLLAPFSARLLARTRLPVKSIPEDKAFPILFFLRAFPISNFIATNLLAGSVRVPATAYFAATFLGMIPSSFMYSSWGKLLKKPGLPFYILAVAIVVALVVASLLMRKTVQRWLTDSPSRP